MENKYIVSIDQSTQGTKALLLDSKGRLVSRSDILHEQIVNKHGWISHDPEEIYRNTVQVIKNLLRLAGIDGRQVVGIGISNQRETSVIWEKKTGQPLAHAIVWQCSRASKICEQEVLQKHASDIFQKTGLKLSPYFPAAKFAWFLRNIKGIEQKELDKEVCYGTIDTWLVFKLTGGRSYKTDYSNASRTQLFNIVDLKWDKDVCKWFGIDISSLPEVVGSDSFFGETSLEGYFENPIPIHGVLGDSHAALFAQGCFHSGMMKATYGTGSSIVMNIGKKPIFSRHGVVTSLAWGINGEINYILEGNLNYTGAVITWLKDNLQLISSPRETEELAYLANDNNTLYIVPAFTGLGAPYWNSDVRAAISGISRTTGKAEFVRAAIECIAYQITDIVKAMEQDSHVLIKELRVDGGPTSNRYLMQFQSDITNITVRVSEEEELSGIGAGFVAGIALDIFPTNISDRIIRIDYLPIMGEDIRKQKLFGWEKAVNNVLNDERRVEKQ